jgi:hypothetical protein
MRRHPRRRLRPGLTRASLAAFAAAVLAPAAIADTAPPAGPLPPDLQALEQQAKSLQISSEHMRLTEDIAGSGFAGPFLTVDVQVSERPLAAELNLGVAGRKFEERVIGTTLYVKDPAIGRRDGGRPWVRVPKRGISELTGLAPNAISNGPQSQDVLTSLLTQLAPQNIKEVGPSTANGQPATEFTGTTNFRTLIAGSGSKVSKQLQKALKKLGSATITLDLFVAANGLPTRTVLAIDPKVAPITETVDILAINIPVAVQAPPLRQTIGYKKVRKLLHNRL